MASVPVRARLQSIAHHDCGVRRITLHLTGTFRHRAGQYLNVVHPSGGLIPLSIASAPERLPELELHYRSSPGVAEAVLMNELLEQADSGRCHEWIVDGPHGDVTVQGPTTDALMLIAGGTGIAQCRAIVEHLRAAGQRHRVHLLWSVTDSAQLYCDGELRAFATWLSYLPLVDLPGESNAAAAWLRQTRSRIGGRVIVSGSPGFTYAVTDVLREVADADATIESDVFSYAPRR